jgi:hypothetical protein
MTCRMCVFITGIWGEILIWSSVVQSNLDIYQLLKIFKLLIFINLNIFEFVKNLQKIIKGEDVGAHFGAQFV